MAPPSDAEYSDEEDLDSDATFTLTNFLFGNVDTKTGALEDGSLLGNNSHLRLRGLHRLGFETILPFVKDLANEEGEDEDYDEDGSTTTTTKVKMVKVVKEDGEETVGGGDHSDDSGGSGDTYDTGDTGHSSTSPTKSERTERKKRKLITSDSDDSDEDEDDDSGGEYDNDTATSSTAGTQGSQDKVVEVESYEDIKSESAIDYFDMDDALSDEDEPVSVTVLQSAKKDTADDTDYDDEPVGAPAGPSSADDSIAQVTSQDMDTDASGRKLETPLAAMLPSKYANVEVTDLFPDFNALKVLRFSRLFGLGRSVMNRPIPWKYVRRRRRKWRTGPLEDGRERMTFYQYYNIDPDTFPENTELMKHDEEQLVIPCESTGENTTEAAPGPPFDTSAYHSTKTNLWRHGPAALWFDMLGVPPDADTFDYGFKAPRPKAQEESENDEEDGNIQKKDLSKEKPENKFPDEAFHMVTQLEWEQNIIWDGHDPKLKKLTKSKVAGWVPSGVNRTAQTLGAGLKGETGAPTPSTSGHSSAASKSVPSTSSPTKGQKGKAVPVDDNAGEDTWYSIFPVETSELVYGRWENEIIWDVDKMENVPSPRPLVLDPNDENIILYIPDDVDPTANSSNSVPVKVKIPHPHVKKSKILLGKAGVINVIEEDSPPPSPKNDDKDPYNISNDEYYQVKHTEQSLLKISPTGNIIQHATPVVELRAPFIPTHMPPHKLRAFHRPTLKKLPSGSGPSGYFGPYPLYPLNKNMIKKAKAREAERLAAGGVDIFLMRTPEDFSGKDGQILLFEYSEEHPPLLSQVGMCSRIKNYYKRRAVKDDGPPKLKWGETTFAHTSPFLGAMHPGQVIQAIENNMYRAPIFTQMKEDSDFLVIRNRTTFFIREFEGIYVVAQECPLFEVFGPNSKRSNNFVRDFLQVFIYRLFWKSRDTPKRIRMDDIKRAFPMHSESSIRKRLKLCADFKRTGVDSNWWVIKPEFRLPTEEEIRAMVSPEQCCAYLSLIAAEQRLKDAGYGEKFLFTPQDEDDEDNQVKIDDEVKTAPWNTTRAYIQAMKGKCLLQLSGVADPTGCGEGFSFIRVPNKPQTNRVEVDQQPKRIVTGTDADLRRLSLNNAKALLRKFGVPEEEIQKLSRWEVIDVVRTLSTEKAKAGERAMSKFSRGNRFSVAEHQERYKEECQRIFELQNRVLNSTETLSTDEEESNSEDEELTDIEEMGKSIENMLSNRKSSSQLNHEREELERQELQRMIMDDDKKGKSKKDDAKAREDDKKLSALMTHPNRILKITRIFKGVDGKEFTRTEIIRKSWVIDIYVRIRTTKDDVFMKQFALLDDAAKEEMKKERRRIQEQLRRIKRNKEREKLDPKEKKYNTKKLIKEPRLLPSEKKKLKIAKPPKVKPDLKLKCGACGQVGHMRTNKSCPLYQNISSPTSSINVEMTEEQEEHFEQEHVDEEQDQDLVQVDGTKVSLSGKLVKQVEEAKRKSRKVNVSESSSPMTSKFKSKRRVAEHCDYLEKKGKTTKRRRFDPAIILGNIFEEIIKEMQSDPDSSHFMHPVGPKVIRYAEIVKTPMDLTTMREKIRQGKYLTREDFLDDAELLYSNSVKYNGPNHLITVYSQRLRDIAKKRIVENASKLSLLEKMINPLLDDNYQRGFAYILEKLMERIKMLPEAAHFLKPVNRKVFKNYYDVIEHPMDLETMDENIQEMRYQNRAAFFADLELIYNNAVQFNGEDSAIAERAAYIINFGKVGLQEFETHLGDLEAKIRESNMKDAAEEFVFSPMDHSEGSQDSIQSPKPAQPKSRSQDFNDSASPATPATPGTPFTPASPPPPPPTPGPEEVIEEPPTEEEPQPPEPSFGLGSNEPNNIHADLEVSDSDTEEGELPSSPDPQTPFSP